MKLLFILSILLLLPTTLVAGDFFQTIPMEEVLRLMKRPGVAIMDVNIRELWEKHHIPGAIHLEGENLAEQLPRDKGATVIFYCAGPLCRESAHAANDSVLLGFRHVYVMTDGIFTWVRAGYPVEPAAPVPKSGTGER